MTVEEALKSALDTLGVPAQRLYYDGTANTFITFQSVLGAATGFADDTHTREEYTYRIDLYSKADYSALIRQAKQALRAAGFYGIIVDPEVYERDTGYYHVPIEIHYMEV